MFMIQSKAWISNGKIHYIKISFLDRYFAKFLFLHSVKMSSRTYKSYKNIMFRETGVELLYSSK